VSKWRFHIDCYPIAFWGVMYFDHTDELIVVLIPGIVFSIYFGGGIFKPMWMEDDES